MNILLINHYAGTPEYGMEFRPYYLGKEWVEQGHEVMIVGGSFSHLRKKQPNNLREVVCGIRYYWIKLNHYRGNGLGRIFSILTFVFKLYYNYKHYLQEFKPDIVIASSTYPLDIYPACKIAKCYQAKLVFEIHDLWPLSPIVLGGYSKNNPFIRVMQSAEDFAYKYCDKCISILPHVQDHVKKHGLNLKKLRIITNGFCPEEWNHKITLNEGYKLFFRQLKNERKKILGYIGGHALSNALDLLVEAMAIIEDSDIVAVLIGEGSEKKKLMEIVEERKLANVFFLPPVEKEMVPALLDEMDVLYLGGKNNPLYRFGTSQTKLFDYFQSAKPIVQTISPPNNYVDASRSGVTIKDSSPQAVAKGIEWIMTRSKRERTEMGLRGKKYCDSNFNYTKLAIDFINYIK